MQAILNIRMSRCAGGVAGVGGSGLDGANRAGAEFEPSQKSDNKTSGSSQAQPPRESSKAGGRHIALFAMCG